jgi:uncharacterized protein (DUF1501 family)
MSKPTRREFIKTGAGALGAGMMLPVLNRTAAGTTLVKQIADNAVGNGNILVIVELAGGNDGLNTIVPLAQYSNYAALRTRIAIPQDQVLPLYGANTINSQPTMGLAPSLSVIKPLADAQKLAVIQAVGYPTPNLSHFSSRDIWYSAVPNPNITTSNRTGWIGRHSALFGNKANSLDTVSIGSVNTTLYASGATAAGISASSNGDPTGYTFNTDGSFSGDRNNQIAAAQVMDQTTSPLPYIDLLETSTLDAITSADLVAQADNAYDGLSGPHSGHTHVTYPTTGNSFAAGLKLIAKLATYAPTFGTRVFYISTGGYDTHADQLNPNNGQAALLGRVAAGLKAFYDDLAAHNLSDKVIVLVWSEFGRRVADNASIGTDHGTANNVFVLGDKVKGGVYGADPSLTDLSGGNLKFKIDFRQVYATIIQDWLGGDPTPVLNGSFSNLGFLVPSA